MGDLKLTVHCDREVKKQNDLFGIFFEDINHAADGGLYGELVRNRSFEFNTVDCPGYHEMTAWSVVERGDSVVQAHVETRHSLNAENPHYLVLEVLTEGDGGGISNEGYGQGNVDITDFCYTDCETGRTETTEDFSISEEQKKHFCLTASGSSYQITFRFCRRNGGLAKNLEGMNSFELEFAGKDEGNKFTWIFDGWQRLTSVNGFVGGHCADLGLYEFESEKDRVHEAKLIVEGDRIRTYIDGALYCDHICKKPVPGRIYYSAVKELDGTVNVKAVNPEEQERLIRIELKTGENAFSEKVKLILMAGYSLDDRNSLENPKLVSPTETLCEWDGKTFEYRLPGNSFAVMRFQVKDFSQ